MSLWQRIGRGVRLERFRFGVYIGVPVAAVILYSIPAVHERAITGRRYIVYTPSDVPQFNRRRGKNATSAEDEAEESG